MDLDFKKIGRNDYSNLIYDINVDINEIKTSKRKNKLKLYDKLLKELYKINDIIKDHSLNTNSNSIKSKLKKFEDYNNKRIKLVLDVIDDFKKKKIYCSNSNSNFN